MKLGSIFSISILFWYIVAIIRFLSELIFSKRANQLTRQQLTHQIKQVAICLPAHNEEVVIFRTITSLKRIVSASQIFVVSDGSSDQTAEIARRQGLQVLELDPARGKAKALVALISKFQLLKRYRYILFVDADTLIDKNYLARAVPVFESNPQVAAIAGYVVTNWPRYRRLTWRRFFVAYRVKLNRLLQLLITYGQSWRYTNVVSVIPGSCSMYRTAVLKKLEIDTPGLLIEDFNLAFQIHRKKLGIIGHYPSIFSLDQDPDNLRDYIKQVSRWNIGFFQTVRKYGIWPSFFWVALGLFSFEVLSFALFLVILPLVITMLIVSFYIPTINLYFLQVPLSALGGEQALRQILIVIGVVVLLIDYGLTVVVALVDKKYQLLIYGLGFSVFSVINSLILLMSLPQGLLIRSAGIWTPPTRR